MFEEIAQSVKFSTFTGKSSVTVLTVNDENRLLLVPGSPVASLGGCPLMPLLWNTVVSFQDRVPEAWQQKVMLCLEPQASHSHICNFGPMITLSATCSKPWGPCFSILRKSIHPYFQFSGFTLREQVASPSITVTKASCLCERCSACV